MPAGNTYEAIATTTLGSSSSSVTFSSISGAYTDLVLVIAGTMSSGDATSVQVNSDTGSNYSSTRLYGDGTTATSDRLTSQTKSALGLMMPAQSVFTVHFMNYANTTTYKTFLGRSSAASGFVEAAVGLWRNTAAITSITATTAGQTYQTGSTFSLYGIKAA
jgi:hypothetical protein